MANAARDAGVVARRIHLAVAIDRLLARLLMAAPGQWVVKGGYANQLRRPDNARSPKTSTSRSMPPLRRPRSSSLPASPSI